MNKWIPCSKKLPDETGDYLVCFDDGYIIKAMFDHDYGKWGDWAGVYDWETMELSEGSLFVPFKESYYPVEWFPIPESTLNNNLNADKEE